MKYQSYKHYVLSGHPDTPESWIAYRLAITEESATEAGLTLPDKTRKLLRSSAAATFNLRYTLPTPAKL